jgi:hypothetical protein
MQLGLLITRFIHQGILEKTIKIRSLEPLTREGNKFLGYPRNPGGRFFRAIKNPTYIIKSVLYGVL